MREYAEQTMVYWDNDQDHKVGKRLMAMAGLLPSYDAKLTDALALLEPPAKADDNESA